MTLLAQMDADFAQVEAQGDLLSRLLFQVKLASSLEVRDEVSFRSMTSLYSESKTWEKKIEFLRKEWNAPDQARINARNDKAKELLNPLKEIQQIANSKCQQYQQMLEQQKAQEQAKLDKAMEMLGLEDYPILAPVEKSIRGDGAIAYTRTIRKFRIVQEDLIPRKYLMIDEEAIARDIKLGIAEIPGVEVFEEKVSQLRTR